MNSPSVELSFHWITGVVGVNVREHSYLTFNMRRRRKPKSMQSSMSRSVARANRLWITSRIEGRLEALWSFNVSMMKTKSC